MQWHHAMLIVTTTYVMGLVYGKYIFAFAASIGLA
jgi:hypothetical protein